MSNLIYALTLALGFAAAPVPSEPSAAENGMDAALSAEFAATDGQPAVAARHYLRAAKQSKRVDYAERAARLALYARDFPLAEEVGEFWLSINPNHLGAMQTYAFAALAQGDKARALIRVRALLLRPEPEAGPLAVSLLMAPDARALAVELLGELKSEPALLALPPERGLIPAALRLKQPAVALELAKSLTAAKPKSSKAWVWRGLSEAASEDQPAAATSYARALALDPSNVPLRLTYVQILNELKRTAEIERVLKAAPIQDATLLQARVAFAAAGQDKKALRKVQREIKRTKGLELADKQMLLGQVSELLQRPREAIRWYKSVTKGEHWPQAQLRLAVLHAAKDLPAARSVLQSLQRAEVSTAQRVDGYLLEAELLNKAEQAAVAREVLTVALETYTDEVQLLYARAMTALTLKDLSATEADLKRITVVDPENAQAWNALGYTLLDNTERGDEALNYIQHAYALNQDSGAIVDSLGWAYFKQGQLDQAIVQLRRAYQLEPEAEIAAHLGEALWTIGAEQEAAAIWAEALKAAPESEALKATIQRLNPQRKTVEQKPVERKP